MPESNTISLVIPQELPSNLQTLGSQIQQIISQKGHFRNVNESSLVAEIHGKASAPGTTQVDQEIETEAEEDDTPQKRTERLWERKNQMLERLAVAQNEILCTLDFVSWLISQQSVPARHSMSAPLKEAAPIGSLAARVLEERPIPLPVRKQLVSVSQGWRSEGFHSASEKLSVASSRLKTEAEHEAQFWHQVADLRAQGWPISRLPRDRKAIGVHFGFAEAAPQFRDRGFALLLQTADGAVGLDTRSLPKKSRHLAVYIVRDGVKTGAFHFDKAKTADALDISQQLTNHRDALFEEELFYEICREARLVANQGIITRGQTVDIDVGDYQLSLVSSDEQEILTSTNDEDNSNTAFVAMSLRLLLNAAHEQNLARRSQKTPAMTTKARTTPEYALIRPIMTHLRHRAEAGAFWNNSHSLLHPFKNAGLPNQMFIEDSSTKVFDSLKIERPETILSEMMMPAKTAFKLTLAGGRSLQVGLATFLRSPLLGSRYNTSAVDFGFSKLPSARHESRDAAVAFVQHVLLLDLVAHAEALTKGSAANAVPHTDTLKDWAVSQPHSGELTLNDSHQVIRKMRFSVQPGSISVKVNAAQKKAASSKVIWTWTDVSCSKAEGTAITKEQDVTFDGAIKQLVA
ncbi:RNA polymerase II mediator complex subunit [Cladophialophora chaetospira]|uniref:Mediator of RNA polymerase II transcription subunit 17 n=1 Tax=Cladophialophora chaetospira TaxID=386627 RepID=A0AA38X3N0_9EURO|nr:RNA polymerase II mediator complex subunit [Cladophialophora chaetospira]